MRVSLRLSATILSMFALMIAQNALAQDGNSASSPAEKVSAAPSSDVKADPKKVETENSGAPKKMVQNATINLQTTVTGNQEQPRVLYILPWQSPAATDVDFEPLDNEQKAVFNHVEREELRRELESATDVH